MPRIIDQHMSYRLVVRFINNNLYGGIRPWMEQRFFETFKQVESYAR